MRELIRTDAGDSIVLEKDDWAAALLASSDRHDYIKSLELIRGLDFGVTVPWATSLDGSYYGSTDKSDIGRRIDEILERMRRHQELSPISHGRRQETSLCASAALRKDHNGGCPLRASWGGVTGEAYREALPADRQRTGNRPATDQQPERTGRMPMTGQGGSVAVFPLYKEI